MDFLFYTYEFLTKFIPFLAVFLLYAKKYKSQGIRMSKLHVTSAFLFAVYMACVFHVTGAGTLYETFRYFQYDMGQIANILMMMPFGFLLPLISPKSGKFRIIFLSGFLFSLSIELSQLFNYRATDIDDLILNTLGAILGYEICQAGLMLFRKNEPKDSYSVFEPFIYAIVLFLGHYFLFDGLRMASLIYGF